MRIFFDDITLYKIHSFNFYSAYSTLISAESRKEYDEYIESYQGLSNMYGDNNKNQDDDEETQRRKKERGKTRFEEDFDHVNEEFFSNF